MTDAGLVALSRVALPPARGLRRRSPLPPDVRPADQDARFDALTLFYDAVHLAGPGVVRLYAPTPLDLLPAWREAEFRLGGRAARPRRIRRCRRYATVQLAAPRRPERLSVSLRGWSGEVAVHSDLDCAALAGRTCF